MTSQISIGLLDPRREQAAAALDDEQLRRYRENGYLLLESVFDVDEVERLRTAVEDPELRERRRAGGGQARTVHLLEICARHPVFRALACSRRLVTPIVQLLGDDVQLQHSKLAAKPPTRDAGPFQWHQDFAYFPHSNTDLAAVMVLLDDADPDNGCLHVVPGSQRWGLVDHLDERGVFSGGVRDERILERCASGAVPLTAPAGSISIHHCLTVHGSHPNRSGRERRTVVFQYRADDAYQFADQVWADTGFQVAGRARGRVRCEAAEWQLPRRGDGSFGNAWRQRAEPTS